MVAVHVGGDVPKFGEVGALGTVRVESAEVELKQVIEEEGAVLETVGRWDLAIKAK